MSYEYLKPHGGPVVEGLEGCEIVYAADQPQYIPLRTLRTVDAERRVISRWALNDVQRDMVAGGGDIYLELLTFGEPLQPIRVAVGRDVDATDAFLPGCFAPDLAPDVTGDDLSPCLYSRSHETEDDGA